MTFDIGDEVMVLFVLSRASLPETKPTFLFSSCAKKLQSQQFDQLIQDIRSKKIKSAELFKLRLVIQNVFVSI